MSEKNCENKMDKIVALCKRRGFIFQGSDIYGGLANTWDYGPFGVELKNNIKRAWWKSTVYKTEDIFGLDTAILMHPKIWEASGHIKNFYDTYLDCKNCKKRIRIDDPQLKDKQVCPFCNKKTLTGARDFNLMFKTYFGAIEDCASEVYLRPETAQGIFTNFQNIIDSLHPKLPFGIAQIGKAFRNEVTPGNFTFRTREFEQMEIEYFVEPKEAEESFKHWVEKRFDWYVSLGIKKSNLRLRQHEKNELAHYAKSCTDIEYNFPFGWSELEGIANRADFDLKQHIDFSGKDLRYFDNEKKERFLPYIIEPSGGIDRAALAFLVDAYKEEKVKDDLRVSLNLHYDLAPVKVAVFPLLKKKSEIVEMAKKIVSTLKKKYISKYDDSAAIGKLYRRQDEIGTPFCITIDVDSLTDKKVTVRDRDSMKQDRIGVSKIEEYLNVKFSNGS